MAIHGDYKLCIEEANAFFETAKMCEDKWDGFVGGILYPLVVNCTFACELYMKAIAIYRSTDGTTEPDHNLLNIFSKLPIADQRELRKRYTQAFNEELGNFLNASGNSFINWRYAYEKGCGINVTKIMKFSEILKDYVSQIS